MKQYILTILLCVTAVFPAMAFESSTGGRVFYTESLRGNMRSVQIENYSHNPYYPIIEMGTTDQVTLKFDDLSPDVTTYTYSLIHCNSQWQQDGLSESQYIYGFTGTFPEAYETSRNTFQPYTHYEVTFPTMTQHL